MPIYTNPTLHLAKPGERWRKDPIKTGGTITALVSHHARKTGGVGRQLLTNEALALQNQQNSINNSQNRNS